MPKQSADHHRRFEFGRFPLVSVRKFLADPWIRKRALVTNQEEGVGGSAHPVPAGIRRIISLSSLIPSVV